MLLLEAPESPAPTRTPGRGFWVLAVIGLPAVLVALAALAMTVLAPGAIVGVVGIAALGVRQIAHHPDLDGLGRDARLRWTAVAATLAASVTVALAAAVIVALLLGGALV